MKIKQGTKTLELEFVNDRLYLKITTIDDVSKSITLDTNTVDRLRRFIDVEKKRNEITTYYSYFNKELDCFQLFPNPKTTARPSYVLRCREVDLPVRVAHRLKPRIGDVCFTQDEKVVRIITKSRS